MAVIIGVTSYFVIMAIIWIFVFVATGGKDGGNDGSER